MYNSVEGCEKALEDTRDPEDECFLFSHPSTCFFSYFRKKMNIFLSKNTDKIRSLGKEVYLLTQSLCRCTYSHQMQPCY